MTNTYKDHVGRWVSVSTSPQRIISLCPSITETLYSFGLQNEIVGRTRYCIHPEDQIQHGQIVGGTKQIQRDVIDRLKPDLIIAEKEENPKEMVEELARDYPVYVTNVESYQDAIQMIRDLGSITDRRIEGERLAASIDREFQQLEKASYRIGYLIWKKPYMAAGSQTYINSMLACCGFENVFTDLEGRYPSLETEQIQEKGPDFLFLSSEPFPFAEQHQREIESKIPGLRTILVDGEMFSWYGVRMLSAVSYFKQLVLALKQKK